MEIINCADNSIWGGRPRTGSFSRALSRAAAFLSGRISRPPFGHAGAKRYSRAHEARPARSSFDIARALGHAKSALSAPLARAAKALPLVILFASSPVIANMLISYRESFIRPLDLSAPDDAETSALDAAMSALAQSGTSYYDAEGNIIAGTSSAEDEGAAEAASGASSFKESVAYRTYTVKNGDTISGISASFGLSNISTLIAVNDISNVRVLRVGQRLRVPSYDGILHTVKRGDTLESIAKRYGVSVSDLLDVNDLTSDVLEEGQTLFIAGAKLDTVSLRRAMGELFTVPIKAKYWITDRFGRRSDPFTGVPSNHTGVDLACPKGTPIYASLSGRVVYTGYSSVFGNYVILNHYNGYQTLYAHMSKILVKKGQYVFQDARIGLVGSTGYSTGPHLHFTVYKNSHLIDPLSVLK